MRFLGFGKRKSKARHTSPVQQLVLHTQNLGRAHSCSDLDRIEKRESWANGPPAQMVPYPSAGGRQSRQDRSIKKNAVIYRCLVLEHQSLELNIRD